MALHRNPLGRGLDSLISMDDTPARGSSAINDVPLDKITPNPEQPRSSFDEAALEELAASIRELGIIQPLSLRKTGPDSYQIIAGERRFRAARLAGLDSVPAYIRTANDSELTEGPSWYSRAFFTSSETGTSPKISSSGASIR